MIKIDNFIKKS